MSFHREGFVIIAITICIAIAIVLATNYWIKIDWLKWILYLFSGVMLILVLQFFRNPTRTTVINPSHIIAPCDGKVVIIEEAEEPEYFKGKRLQVSIFMSPLNVHVNRNPVSGKVVHYKYHEGEYLVAWHPKSSTLNERTTVVVETASKQEVLFRQIAGAVARRIVCYVDKGDVVTQGEEFGFIKFGSRVDLFLPLGTEISVDLEQKTVGGETVIGVLK